MSDQCVCPSTISIVFGGLKEGSRGEEGEFHETEIHLVRTETTTKQWIPVCAMAQCRVYIGWL